jgi:hypothetical protein
MVALVVLTSAPAAAQKTIGYGETPCRSWSQEHRANTPISLAYSAWLLGFISGINVVGILQADASRDFVRATSAKEVIGLTDAHCAAHPDDNLDSAGFALIGKLREKAR